MDEKRAMSVKKRKIDSPAVVTPEGKKKKTKLDNSHKEDSISVASSLTISSSSANPTTAVNKLSKKKEKRKLFKKETKKKLLKEGKLSWRKKKMEKKTKETSKADEKSAAAVVSMPITSQVAPPKNSNEISANWKALQQVLQRENGTKKSGSKKKRNSFQKRGKLPTAPVPKPNPKSPKENAETSTTKATAEDKPEIWFEIDDESLLERPTAEESKKDAALVSLGEGATGSDNVPTGVTDIVGLDCEMVGVGEGGVDSILARVSIVNQYGHPIYDKYVKPTETVTDYRTAFSGIRPHNLGQDAVVFKTVQAEVAEILKDRILVGHSLFNDLQVLFLSHHHKRIRDTQKYKPFKKLCGGMPSLKKLAATVLNVDVQSGEHSSVEDAQTAMRLYMMHRAEWEKDLKDKKKKGIPKKKDP